MNKKTIILIVTLFVLLVVGMFIFAYLKKIELTETSTAVVPATDSEVLYPDITSVTAKHYFINGVHTLVGEMLFPTPCDLLETEVLIMESYPEQVRIDFDVINTAESCAQVMTDQRFKVEAAASPAASFSATFLGRPIELNLVPAAEGEVPEDFELFIKG